MRTQQVEEAAHLAATQGSVGGKPDTEPDRARAAESPRTAHYDGVRIDARERIINSLSLSLNSAEIVQVWTLSSSPIPRLGLSFFFLSFTGHDWRALALTQVHRQKNFACGPYSPPSPS